MATENRTVRPGTRAGTVRTLEGDVLDVPEGWGYLPPGDAGLTRRVKAAGPTWTIMQKRGRREMSQGLFAPEANIARAQAGIAMQRARPEHGRRLEADRARRERQQAEYVVDFTRHVHAFLAFHPRHAALADEMARRVAAHATPVGSGTVARTKRIPVQERAEAAVIAWLRHQTTAYDRMSIARVKGERRAVRRELARRSRELLQRYRDGQPVAEGCPLAAALARPEPAAAAPSPPRKSRPAATPAPAPAPKAATPAPKPAPKAATPAPAPAPKAAPPAPKPAAKAAKPTPPAAAPPAATDATTELDRRAARQRAVRERLGRR